MNPAADAMSEKRSALAAPAETTSSRSEWRLPLLTGLALALVTAMPYAYAYAAQPHGQVFMGFFFLGDDANTYLAKMRQGWEGAWAWQNRYTTESSSSAYLFMFWILLGHLAALLHLPLIAVFHLARVGAAFALMGSAWLFISLFIEDRSARRFAFFFVAIGLGMGLVIQAIGHPVILGHQTDTLDLRMPELTAFYSVLALPHFAWSGVFAGVGAALTLKAIQRGSLGLAALAGGAWLGQASIHPQMPIMMGGDGADLRDPRALHPLFVPGVRGQPRGPALDLSFQERAAARRHQPVFCACPAAAAGAHRYPGGDSPPQPRGPVPGCLVRPARRHPLSPQPRRRPPATLPGCDLPSAGRAGRARHVRGDRAEAPERAGARAGSVLLRRVLVDR